MPIGIIDVIISWTKKQQVLKKIIAVRRLQSSWLPSRFVAVAFWCLNSRLNLPPCIGSLHAKNIHHQHFCDCGFRWRLHPTRPSPLIVSKTLKVTTNFPSRCLCASNHRSHTSLAPLGRRKISVFIRPFNAITSKKIWVTYDNESFDPCGSSVYWRFDHAASDIS